MFLGPSEPLNLGVTHRGTTPPRDDTTGETGTGTILTKGDQTDPRGGTGKTRVEVTEKPRRMWPLGWSPPRRTNIGDYRYPVGNGDRQDDPERGKSVGPFVPRTEKRSWVVSPSLTPHYSLLLCPFLPVYRTSNPTSLRRRVYLVWRCTVETFLSYSGVLRTVCEHLSGNDTQP